MSLKKIETKEDYVKKLRADKAYSDKYTERAIAGSAAILGMLETIKEGARFSVANENGTRYLEYTGVFATKSSMINLEVYYGTPIGDVYLICFEYNEDYTKKLNTGEDKEFIRTRLKLNENGLDFEKRREIEDANREGHAFAVSTDWLLQTMLIDNVQANKLFGHSKFTLELLEKCKTLAKEENKALEEAVVYEDINSKIREKYDPNYKSIDKRIKEYCNTHDIRPKYTPGYGYYGSTYDLVFYFDLRGNVYFISSRSTDFFREDLKSAGFNVLESMNKDMKNL